MPSTYMKDKDLIFVVYNPSIEDQTFTKLMQSDNDLHTVHYWNPEKQEFNEAKFETQCYKNPDQHRECEVFVNHVILPYKYQIFKVSKT